jgi:hypothetical protein
MASLAPERLRSRHPVRFAIQTTRGFEPECGERIQAVAGL